MLVCRLGSLFEQCWLPTIEQWTFVKRKVVSICSMSSNFSRADEIFGFKSRETKETAITLVGDIY